MSREELWVKLNGFRLMALLVFSVALAFALTQGSRIVVDKWQRDALLVGIGALTGVIAQLMYGLVTSTEGYKQGAYTERAKAVQVVLRSARRVKVRKLGDYRIVNLPEHLQEQSWSFQKQEDADRGNPRDLLLAEAFEQSVWTGEAGVNAVRSFLLEMNEINVLAIDSQEDLEAQMQTRFKKLVDALLEDLGHIPSDN